ncbi:PA0069 family radical SAM protein [Limibacillus halophilus]|uniref:DNA repair photolyase n=1 Tax=Limibacillus halophilus TaxID=1579333 RepID=A0A839SWH0_9PROT|nr:PA0069 family radical SAM protein [Limibacillus halophilus]MBB3066024.1 DNA repair photolyase [Limibacillus halophilus]
MTRQGVHKGRGALSNSDGRYERFQHEAVDDGWGSLEAESEHEKPQTQIQPDRSRSILAHNDSPDVPFDRSINPYRGCEHGCVYCFARPTHAFLGLSPGLDFETKLFAKYDAASLLRREISRPGYQPSPIALGANTDPYQPLEKKLRLTRQILEVLAEAKHPATIVTKSALVLRDLDILTAMAKQRLVRVCVSLTSLDPRLSRIMEPRAASPQRRLDTVAALSRSGVPVTVLTAPLIPAINDHELEALLEAAAEAGAGHAGYVLLRLPLEIKDLFEEWLETHFPDRKNRVLARLKAMRGGKLYDARFGRRMSGEGPEAQLLSRRFKLACRRLGLEPNRETWSLDVSLFRRPMEDKGQMSLL